MNKIEEFIKYVNKLKLGNIDTNKTFKDITTLKIGGKIACIFEPISLDALVIAYKYLKEKVIKYQVIGNGSNILASDKEHKIVVISLKNLNKITKLSEDTFLVSAGVKTIKLANILSEMGYTNHEFLGLIPGTLGGAIYMNASCYDGYFKDILKEVIYLNENSTITSYMLNELDLDYRKSIFRELKGIIISCVIKLKKEDERGASYKKIEELKKKKHLAQQINYYTAGSTFKNPTTIKAWEVVDKLGYRGFIYNDVIISNTHTNFICNQNNASFKDMIYVLNKIKEEAKAKLDIDLEYEWEIID